MESSIEAAFEAELKAVLTPAPWELDVSLTFAGSGLSQFARELSWSEIREFCMSDRSPESHN